MIFIGPEVQRMKVLQTRSNLSVSPLEKDYNSGQNNLIANVKDNRLIHLAT